MIITQILQRIKGAGYVRYLNNKFYDKDDQEIVVATEAGGGGSGDITADVINAADAKATPVDGDKLGLTDSAAGGVLRSLSILNLKAFIVAYLKSLDFVRVNADKDLLSGTDVVVTQAATGMRYSFNVDTGLTDTASGEAKMNNAAPVAGNTVIVTIDYFDKNGTDMSAFMGAWQASGTIALRSASTIDTSFAVLSILTVADQDPTTSFQISGKYIGGTSFVGGESCVIQYTAPTSVGDAINAASAKTTPVDADKLALIDSAASNVLKYLTWASLKAAIDAYLKTLGYTRLDSNGNMLDGSNNIVDGVNPVYALASAPVSGITELPAANAMTNGSVIALHKDCLVGAGANPLGILLRPDTLANVFRPAGDRAILYSKRFGNFTTPTLKMTDTTQATSNIFDIGTNIKIPGGLLYSGCKLEIRMQFRRNVAVVGLGNVLVIGYMGTDAAVPSNNPIFWQANLNDSNDRDASPAPVISVLSGTTAFSTNNISPGEAGIVTAFLEMGPTNFAVASDMYIEWAVSTTLNANNNVDFLGYEIVLVAI